MKVKKILVTTEALTLDRTSEGICSSKFLLALKIMGFDLVCLTSEDALAQREGLFNVDWLPEIPIIHINSYSKPSNGAIQNNQFLNRLVVYSTGWSISTWSSINLWKLALHRIVQTEKPDFIFVRGSGNLLFPHLALTLKNLDCPWIANYHGPFPISLYPPPYKKKYFIVSAIQEKWNNMIMQKASALTFPSERMKKWMLGSKNKSAEAKSFIIPHLAMDVDYSLCDQDIENTSIEKDNFTLIHTGSLLKGRFPDGLLKAFQRFIDKAPIRRKKSRLLFVGRFFDVHLQKNDLLDKLLESGNLQIINRRLSYQIVMRLSSLATAMIIIEASAIESPFFPAKLTDSIWVKKPILALSPQESTVADILGKEYPLLVSPDNEAQIEYALEVLWDAWRKDHFLPLLPNQKCLTSMNIDAFHSSMESLVNFIS